MPARDEQLTIRDLISDVELSRRLSVSTNTLRRWAKLPEYKHLGFPKAIKIEKLNYRPLEAVNAFVRRHARLSGLRRAKRLPKVKAVR